MCENSIVKMQFGKGFKWFKPIKGAAFPFGETEVRDRVDVSTSA